ncbi:PD-(D/E)XK nuclease-like domain-containing protein [Enterococcus olivae]
MIQEEIVLSDENYYTNESDWQYMSNSQIKRFKECEAQAMARLKDDWEPSSDPVALLVGNYVHSKFESPEAHEKFKQENKDRMYSKRSPHSLLKAFQVAEDMIQALEAQEFFTNLYHGEKEVIVQEEYLGVEWKAKIDCLNLENDYFVDIKTSADLEKKVWSTVYNKRVSWVVDFGYYLQMALYAKLLEIKYGRTFTPVIAGVSKQEPPSVKVYQLDDWFLEVELAELEKVLPRIIQVKNGEVAPNYCGKCEYCRGHMKVSELSNTEE